MDLPTYLYDANTPRRLATPGHYAYLKIAEGCDYKCAFCVIPKMRGHYRSRTVDSVVAEARALAARGVKELLLVSQDTTFYGLDRKERDALPRLIRALDGVDGIEWVRLLYLYPTTITDATIEAIAASPKVCRYIDLPLQHASDRVLKRMKRPGTRAAYERLLGNIRAAMPDVTLRTTFIVGFPGEEPADVEELLAFLDAVRFDHVGVFTYSHEEDTSAYALTDDVPAAEKARRQRLVMARQKRIVAARQKARSRRPGPAPGRRPVRRARLGDDRPAGRPGPGNRSPGLPDRVRPRPGRPGPVPGRRDRRVPRLRPGRETGGHSLTTLAASPRSGPSPRKACRATSAAFARKEPAWSPGRRGFAQKAGHDLIAERPVGHPDAPSGSLC